MQAIIDKDVQAVTESFNAVIKELNRVNDDIKQVIADLAMEGKLDKVTESTASATVLTNFTQEVANLSTRWNKGIFGKSKPAQKATTSNFSPVQPRASRTSRAKLRVIFLNNGKQVCLNNCAKTFVEVLQMLNLDEVEKLGIMVNKHHLISKTKLRFDSTIYQCGNWFIDTLSNTNQKKGFLEEISKALKVPIRVEIV